MSSQENKRLVEEVFAAWIASDARVFFDIVADDVCWTVLGTSPVSGVYPNKRAFMETAGRVFEHLSGPIKPQVRAILADGDWVVARWAGEASMKRGGVYRNEFCWVMRIEQRKVVECVAYLDTQAAVELFR